MTTNPPFARVLVPFDGSEPAEAALHLAITLAKHGATITVATVVDETAVIAQAASGMTAFDPTPLMDALEEQATALLAHAADRCLPFKIIPAIETVHDTPVAGIISVIDSHDCDLVVMGTHARSGLARTFLGSTADGVLRSSSVPVLTTQAFAHVQPDVFATVVVAVDDSQPADAALAVAARLARCGPTKIIACHIIDTRSLDESVLGYGFPADELHLDREREARAHLRHALARASLAPDTMVVVRTGNAADAIVEVANEHQAGLVLAGTHGRRGIRRFFLGSVAERLVRTSAQPVLIVPASRLM